MKSSAFFVLILVACGDGDSSNPDAGATDATTDVASSPDANAQDASGEAGTEAGGDAAPGTMTFISQATCNTTPCQSGATPSTTAIKTYPAPPNCPVGPIAGTTNIIGLGAVTNGTTTTCRMYGYYRPKNLVGKATTIFTAGGAGSPCGNGSLAFDGANWYKIADANQLVVILLSYCPTNAWTHPYLDVPDTGPTPTDGPYLAAVVQDAAANASIAIDTSRLVLTGGSSGGSLTWGTACDPTYSTLFKGYAPVSAAMNVPVSNNMPVSGQERCSSANKNFFIANVHGTADGAVAYNGACIASHCITSFAETESFWSKYLGCGATPTKTMFGTPQAVNEKDDFGSCGFGSPPNQYEAVTVQAGGHQHEGLDAVSGNPTNGFDTAQTSWAFFSTRAW